MSRYPISSSRHTKIMPLDQDQCGICYHEASFGLQGSRSLSRPSKIDVRASQCHQSWLEAGAMPSLSKTQRNRCMDGFMPPTLHHSPQSAVTHLASRASLGTSSPQYRYTSLPHSDRPLLGIHRATSLFQHCFHTHPLVNAQTFIRDYHDARCAMDSRNRDFSNMYDFLGVHIAHHIPLP